MAYLGDYAEDYATLNFKFHTHKADGTPVALTSGAVSVYKGSATDSEVTTGVTLAANFDGVTGLNNVLIDLSSAAFYAVGFDYSVVITTGTVDSISVIGAVVGTFSIENRFKDVNVATIDANAITATAIAADAITDAKVASDVTIASVTGAVGSIASGGIASTSFAAGAITNAAVADDVDVNVKTITANAITATAINDNAITDAKVASDVTIASVTGAVGSVAGNVVGSVGSVSGAVGSVASGGIASTSFAAGAITAAAIANAAIDNATLAADIGSTAYATNIIALAVRKVLDELNLDHIAKTATAAADMTTEVADNTILARIIGNGDTSTFVPSTDGLHAAGVDIDAILADTNELQVEFVDGGRLDLILDAILLDTGTTLDGRIPAALTAGGMLKVSIEEIKATALTEGGAGRLAAAFIKLLDVATPLLVASDVMRGTDGAALASAWTATKAGYLTGGVALEATSQAIVTDTNELQVEFVDGGRIDLILDAILLDTGTTLDGRIPAALTAGGQLKVSVEEIKAVALTEGGAGRLAAAFIKLFDVATPLLVASDAMRGTDSAALASAWTSTRASYLTGAVALEATSQTLIGRLGAWTGTGINTVLGAIRALAAKANALTPTDISTGTTYDNTTDSAEAIKDATALEATLTAIKGAGWTDETLVTIQSAVEGISAGSGLTAQQTRDAMKLAPTSGTPNAGSIDAHLDATALEATLTAIKGAGWTDETLVTIQSAVEGISAGSGLTAQQTRDAMKLAPTAGDPAAGSVDAELDALTTAVADVPTNTEFTARTLAAADYVVTTDTIAGVTDKAGFTLSNAYDAAKTAAQPDEYDSQLTAISNKIVTVQADTDNIQARIPAALVGGKMDSVADSMSDEAITAIAEAVAAATGALTEEDIPAIASAIKAELGDMDVTIISPVNAVGNIGILRGATYTAATTQMIVTITDNSTFNVATDTPVINMDGVDFAATATEETPGTLIVTWDMTGAETLDLPLGRIPYSISWTRGAVTIPEIITGYATVEDIPGTVVVE